MLGNGERAIHGNRNGEGPAENTRPNPEARQDIDESGLLRAELAAERRSTVDAANDSFVWVLACRQCGEWEVDVGNGMSKFLKWFLSQDFQVSGRLYRCQHLVFLR